MESMFKFFDTVDEFIIAMMIRLQRSLSRTPHERRKICRPSVITPVPISAHPAKQEAMPG
ncbi:MAG: hypothetical protein HKP32_11850 [Woeseia sp.]|nr:hypothetical protein [Woeseia sp.]MBT8097206.1 hypothetical protein [Woeseia sp.]NNL55835.1 hypothetical protein [Woeseia sp.]